MSFITPTSLYNENGELRRVGLELEFAGLDIEDTAQLIQSLYGGKIRRKHRYYVAIEESTLGDFVIELDARLLQEMAENNFFERLGVSFDQKTISNSIEKIVDGMARTVVPLEIVMPPVEIEKLAQLEDLRAALQKERAEGTSTSFVNAFGMHINIESPNLHTETLLQYLRAFCIMYPWLLRQLNINFSRRLTPYVDPFPKQFVRNVLETSYQPNPQQFVKDYLKWNPTRNRPLDLLPILGINNEKLVRDTIKTKKNQPRPAFHYRLPNSHVDDSDWKFSKEWNYWAKVENLASNENLVHKLSELYNYMHKETIISFSQRWCKIIEILLDLDE